MRILVCNDDGINAHGLIALTAELAKIGEVTVVAPDVERSAASNSITLSHPLRVKECTIPVSGCKGFAVSGTPADCAKIAIANLLTEKPDLLISGINRGPNMCVDVFYSGTVAAAFEGASKGILSMAVSLDSFKGDADYSHAAKWAGICAKTLSNANLPANLVYNLNIPDLPFDQIKGVKVTRTGKVDYQELYDQRVDPYGRTYYWIQGNPIIVDHSEDCDIVAVRAGFVSLTPLKTDLSCPDAARNLVSANLFGQA